MTEGFPQEQKDSLGASHEALTLFPIVESEEVFHSVESRPDLPEDVIVHWQYQPFSSTADKYDKFGLKKMIGGFPYLFQLSQYYDKGVFILSSKTENYGYAMTNLSPQDAEILFRTRAAFIESLTDYPGVRIERVMSNPAGISYSAEDIDKCIALILAHPDNRFSKEALLSFPAESNGARVFEIYNNLSGLYFHGKHPNQKDRSNARSRLFKMKFKKYLTHWEVSEDFSLGSDFTLQRIQPKD